MQKGRVQKGLAIRVVLETMTQVGNVPGLSGDE